MMLSRAFSSMTGILVCCALFAQVPHGGSPVSPLQANGHIPSVELEPIGNFQPSQKQAGPPFQYGEQIFHTLDVLAEGAWEVTPSKRICRFVLRSPGASMISLQFSTFHMDHQAELYVLNEDRSQHLGAFTSANHKVGGKLATALVPGEQAVLEYHEPLNANGASILQLASITHAYFNPFEGLAKDIDPGYQSAPCHNNVNCAVGSSWQDQKRAVAMFLRPDGNGCTGLLLNNTAEDGTPYFHVANHCYTADEDQWVFYFNYETPGCSGSSGPTTQTISGATLLSNFYFDDFALLELSTVPPSNFNVYYSGWDHSGNTPSSTAVIHHPLYDVKKITLDQHAPSSYASTPYAGAPQDIQMWGCQWDDGIVEPVSSGAPLFDQNGRFIGHMSEGANACAGTANTGCAKFSESWDGSSSSSRLRDWLDPSNSVTVLNGFDPNGAPANAKLDLKVFLSGPLDINNQLMDDALRQQDLLPLSEPYTNLGYNFVQGGDETAPASVFSTSGNNAIVDWVVVELRDKNNSSSVVESRSGLLQRDGDVVDVDGFSSLEFQSAVDDYYVAVRHRRHLGAMALNTVYLDNNGPTVDFRFGATPTYGAEALRQANGTYALWNGDVDFNGNVKYTGADNDRDPILDAIGGNVPTNILVGSHQQDLNMDGLVKYTGLHNDRDIVLQTIGGAIPTAVRVEQLP